MLTNAKAQVDDVLVLTKPLGIGMLSAALKKGTLTTEAYAEMLKWTTTLNKVGSHLATIEGVHAMTDVTGIGLAGHLLEMCRGAKLQANINFSQLSFIDTALSLAQQGTATGASTRNWQSYGESIELSDQTPLWQRNLLTDPQTSGGLLISCTEQALPQVQQTIKSLQGNDSFVCGKMAKAHPKGIVTILS